MSDPQPWYVNAVWRGSLNKLVNARGDRIGNIEQFRNVDPVRAMALLNNWLTAGGAPKPIDPVDIFGPAQAMSGVEARISAGRGVAGLFGFGKLIGELSPSSGGPAVPGQAPLAPGVPYGAKPIPRSQGFFK